MSTSSLKQSGLAKLILPVALYFTVSVSMVFSQTAVLTIQADQPGAVVSSNLFGLFFEEINFAGDGGLYAELLRNRTFDNSANPDYWSLVTQGTAAGAFAVDTSRQLNVNRPRCLKLVMSSGTGSVGAANSGYWGISLKSGATYDLSFYASSTNGFSGVINARLESTNGATIYAQTNFTTALGTNWQRFSASLVSSTTDASARLVVSLSQRATIWLNVVSLFPRATFFGRTNGLRTDIAGLLASNKFSFMRYPGGNFIEGDNVTNAVRWKKTIGDIAQRPGHWCPWGYWSTDGFGLQEYLQFCEDAGMEPLYGIFVGLALGYNGDTNNTVPLNQMGPYVQDALDLIQYCNGDTNTTWGAARAANGHPAPFNLKYLEVGNENGGAFYNDRYALFYDAVKSNYPDIKIISPNWGGPASGRPVEITDEHYYLSTPQFYSSANQYDSYSRSGPKVFVGEYATTAAFGTLDNVNAALGEAAFMTGMERNSDIVQLASYAPMLANVNGPQWMPDMIFYDSSRIMGTPSFYDQAMFSQNRGDYVLPQALSVNPVYLAQTPRGAIGLASWLTSVQYTNITVTSNGVVLYQSDFAGSGATGWTPSSGTWSASSGIYQQTSLNTDCRSTTGNTNWANYTLSLRARKVSGSEGFLIIFNWLDNNNLTWLNIGGWGNTLHGVEQTLAGNKSLIGAQVAGSVQTNVWYDISVTLAGTNIQCFLNGASILNVNYPAVQGGGLAASCTYQKSSGQIILKAVNPFSTATSTTINVAGAASVASSAQMIQLTSGSSASENSLTSPNVVVPVTNTVTGLGTNFTISLPAYSFSILRLQPGTINTYTNVQLQLAPQVGAGRIVSGTAWGWKSGQAVNLTTNVNHSLVWSSSNPSVATVDPNGNVLGVAVGSANITVEYPALNLAATQSFQVVTTTTTLLHRYSFSEVGGTNVNDSIGGAAWKGTVPAGGALSGGQLTLNGSGQYANLPQGIVSSLTNLTIMAWVKLNSSANWNRICDFGLNTTTYMALTPQNGYSGTVRFVISTNSNAVGAEQQINCGLTLSTGAWHQVTVTLAYGNGYGTGILYVDGTAVGTNSAMTLTPSLMGANSLGYLGKSLWSDPYFNGQFDEFRLYNDAMSGTEVMRAYSMGPDLVFSATATNLTCAVNANVLTLSWPADHIGWRLLMQTNNLASGISLNTNDWMMVSGSSTTNWVVLPANFTPGADFFRLVYP